MVVCFPGQLKWPEGRVLRVLLADDHALLRAGLRELLEERGVDVIGEATDGQDAVEQALALRPDVVLMDLNMPRVPGTEATRQIKRRIPNIRVLVLTVSRSEADVIEAFVAGADGYVLKDAPIAMILEGIHSAAAGHSLISPAVAVGLVHRVRQEAARHPAGPAAELSNRELEVLRLLARGRGNREIAGELHITTNTVKHHIAAILRKLGVTNRIQAAVYAHEHRLLDGGRHTRLGGERSR
jgi:DNA-binding NarL/FixJ family response regulator